jgi:serine/threonine-protein kinase
MGYAYRAHDRNLETDVIIKVPRRAVLEDAEFAERFGREVRSLVRLSHPHIVKVIDVGIHDGIPFAVMQYLSGGSLEARRNQAGGGRPAPVDPHSLRDWLTSIAAALDFIHRQGFVHRDVKPANILFDLHGNAYLSDFGIAKALAAEAQSSRAASLTGTGMVLGTPNYMAPELVLGKAVDGRVDQYALAVTVHELLAGSPPIDGPTPAAVLVQQATQAPRPLGDSAAQFAGALNDAILRALSKEPAQRFASCAAFAEAVLTAIAPMPAGSPVKWTPPKPITSRGASPGRVPCPECGAVLVLQPKHAGKRARCHRCDSLLIVSDDVCELTLANPVSDATPKQTSAPTESTSEPSAKRRLAARLAGAMPKSRRARYAALAVGAGLAAAIGFLALRGGHQSAPRGEIVKQAAVGGTGRARPTSDTRIGSKAGGSKARPLRIREIGNQRVEAGQPLELDFKSADSSDAGDVTFSLEGDVPRGATIDTHTGRFVWVPTEAQAANRPYTIRARAARAGQAAETTLIVHVQHPNRPPTVAFPSQVPRAVLGKPFTLRVQGNDPDEKDALTYRLNSEKGTAASATIERGTGVISWTPREDEIGSRELTVIVADRAGHEVSKSIAVTVHDERPRVQDRLIKDWVHDASKQQDAAGRAKTYHDFAAGVRPEQVGLVVDELVLFLAHWNRGALTSEESLRAVSRSAAVRSTAPLSASGTPDERARAALEAAELLRSLGPRSEARIKSIADNRANSPARAAAAYVLGRSAFDDAASVLQSLVEQDTDDPVQCEAVLSLLAIAARRSEFPGGAWDFVSEYYRAGASRAESFDEPMVRAVAAVGAPIVDPLLKMLEEPPPAQRTAPRAPPAKKKKQGKRS